MQSQRTKDKIKTSFDFTAIICKYVSKNGIRFSIHPLFITTKYKRVIKISVFRYLPFFVIFVLVYSPVLAPILIQIAYAVHTHTQFNMIRQQSYANEWSL